MPRRRTSKQSTQKSKNKNKGPIQKWNTREDIPLDEVDEFHEQRDKILLEGEEVAPESDYEEDEVFALKGLAESSEDEDEDEDEDGLVDDDEDEEVKIPELQKKKSKLKDRKDRKEEKKKKVNKKTLESSAELSGEDDNEGEEEESWGLKKSTYYSSNAAQIESDDEEAREMEEQEARRLQAKIRAPMREEDFGYSEALQNAVDTEPVDDFWKLPEKPASAIAGKDKISILRHLEKTNPEALALAFEWEDIARQVIATGKIISEMPDNEEDKALGLVHIHHQTLLTYASVLAFYLHLRASEKYAVRPDLLRQHPILKRLLTLKQSLITFEELDFAASASDSGSGEEEEEDELDSEDYDDDDDDYEFDDEMDTLDTWKAAKKLGLEAGELEKLLASAYNSAPSPSPSSVPVKKLPKVKLNVRSKKEAGQRKPEREQEHEPLQKKQKNLNGKPVPAPKVKFDVEEPVLPSSSSLHKHKPKDNSSNTTPSSSGSGFGFGEATTLDEADLADKKGRRKALRFHTAKIESASARRQGARAALGGDDDVPYRGRNKQKEMRGATADKKNLGVGGDDLDDVDAERGLSDLPGGSRKRGRDDDVGEVGKVDGDEDGEDGDEDEGYYSLVKRQKKTKQAEKKAQYEAMKAANRPSLPEDLSQAGQRPATRGMLTNKGLLPSSRASRSRSAKLARNPRVKKRVKFQKAQRKVASQRAVYKLGGIGGGVDPMRYSGETSGISKVVKSVKL